MTREEIKRRFYFHPATDAAVAEAHDLVRTLCRTLARDLNEVLPEGREKSLAITSLEETMMWANAAVARPPAEVAPR